MAMVCCPHCGKSGNVPDQFVGKKIKCKQCVATFVAGEGAGKAKIAPEPPATCYPDLASFDISAAALGMVPEKVAREIGVLPIKLERKTLHLAVPDPVTDDLLQKLTFIFNMPIVPMVADRKDIDREIARRYGPSVAYFESSRPAGNATCSDDSCPCGSPGRRFHGARDTCT